jgi:hypothetical protein
MFQSKVPWHQFYAVLNARTVPLTRCYVVTFQCLILNNLLFYDLCINLIIVTVLNFNKQPIRRRKNLSVGY